MDLGVSVDSLIALVGKYGPVAVFVSMVIEEVFFVIPSSIISIAAGALLVKSTSLLAAIPEMILKVVLPASLGITFGSFFVYGVAYYGGKPAIERFGKYIRLSWEDVEKVEHYFGHEKEKRYLGVLRSIPVVPITTISAAAGVFRMNPRGYGLYTFMGVSLRTFLYAFIGWQAGSNYRVAYRYLSRYTTPVIIILVVLIGAYVLYRRKIKEK